MMATSGTSMHSAARLRTLSTHAAHTLRSTYVVIVCI